MRKRAKRTQKRWIAVVVLLALLLTGCSSGARYVQAQQRNADIRRVAYHVGDYDTGDKIRQQREKNRRDALKDNPDGKIWTDEDLPEDPEPPAPDPEPDTQPEVPSDPEPDSQPDSKPELDENPEPNPEPDESPEPDPEPDENPEPDPEPVSDPEQSTEQQLYQQMVEAMYRAEYPIVLPTDYDTFCNLYRKLKDDPAIFWQRGYSCSYSDTQIKVYFLYTHTTQQEILDTETRLQSVAAECLAAIPAGADDFTKALTIHDWLIENITYVSDGGWHDQTIYGALGLKECVCAGISQAFTYLCRLAGVQATTVTGYAADTPITQDNAGGRHAWNCVVMEENYYYVDVTWDNADTYENGEELKFHNWFGLSREEIYPTHRPTQEQDMPQSNSEQNNYYVRMGYLVENVEQVVQVLAAQEEQLLKTVRFTNSTNYEQAKQSLAELWQQAGFQSSFAYYSRDAFCILDIVSTG